jgi:maleate isomerase
MRNPIRLGMLTPSSNTVLEPVTNAMVRDLPGVTCHFGRFAVTEISLARQALDQFDLDVMLAPARLLADARVDVIAWNGTSASWLGLERDRQLCRAIEDATGIPAITSVLALHEILRLAGVTRLGLVTPYISDVQHRIVENFAGEGIACVAERHLGDQENFAFALVSEERIAAMAREVATVAPQAIVTLCTNLAAAPIVPALEDELDIPIFDSISVVIWKALKVTDIDPARVTGWGRLFADGFDNGLPVTDSGIDSGLSPSVLLA